MNLSLLYSASLHLLLFVLLFISMHQQAPDKNNNAVYTIDFIGDSSGQAMRYGTEQKQAEPAKPKAQEEPKEEVKEEIKEPEKVEEKTEIKVPEPVKEEVKKTSKEYNSEEQISKKAKKNQKKKKKEAPKVQEPVKEEKVKLSKPSILGDVETDNLDIAKLHNMTTQGVDGAPQTVQASFTDFPYPWYITQVRNALWSAWQETRPKNVSGLKTLVSFNIDKNGAIYGIQIEQSSGNESYDYAATSAASKSAPYPPLPNDFNREILTVTVEFKQED